jgi:vacuolar-type H+-ATPase subunit I/STV1
MAKLNKTNKTNKKEKWEKWDWLYETDCGVLDTVRVSQFSKLFTSLSSFLDIMIFNSYDNPEEVTINGKTKLQLLETYHDFILDFVSYSDDPYIIIHGIRYETDEELVKRLEKEKRQKIANEKAKQKRKEQKEKEKLKKEQEKLKEQERDEQLLIELANKYNTTVNGLGHMFSNKLKE